MRSNAVRFESPNFPKYPSRLFFLLYLLLFRGCCLERELVVSDIKNEKEERNVPVKIIPYVEVRTEDDASKFLNKIISKFSKTGRLGTRDGTGPRFEENACSNIPSACQPWSVSLL